MKSKVRVYYRSDTSAHKKKGTALLTEFKGKCHQCLEYGHRQAECPNPKKGKPGGGKRGKQEEVQRQLSSVWEAWSCEGRLSREAAGES